MFISVVRPAVEPQGPDAVAVPGSPAIAPETPRGVHARLLANAALRRQRGLERRRADRSEDADYWFGAAPVAIRKACELRLAGPNFAPIP
jgi:hypothetical protein